MIFYLFSFVRYMLLIQGDGELFFIDRDNSVFKINNIKFPHVNDKKRTLRDTLLDGVITTYFP